MRFLFWALLLGAPAGAADWPMIQGTELGRPDAPFVPGGFIQLEGEAFLGETEVEGLSPALSAFEGERPAFNGEADLGFAVRRARPIFRGSIPGTDQRINWLLAAEFGRNQLNRGTGASLADASVTFSYIPGLRLRAGQFKLPLMDETLQTKPVAARFVSFSEPARLLLESRVESGVLVGGAQAFRDIGLQAFDSFTLGPVALSYAAMVSNGRPNASEDDEHQDLSGRLSVSWLLDDESSATDPDRNELSLLGWHQRGQRALDGEEGSRIRQGLGLLLHAGPLAGGTEWVWARGMIEIGPNPPFAGQPVLVDLDGEAWGGTAWLGLEVGQLGLASRWSFLEREGASPADRRLFRTLTPSISWQPSRRARVQLDYEWRQLEAPDASPDAMILADALADRVVTEVTVVF